MPGGDLTGIGSFEEMLLRAAEEGITAIDVPAEAPDKMEHDGSEAAASIVLQDRSQPVQMYAIDMDIGENMGTLKSRAAEALHLDLHDCSVSVLSEKELDDEETLQEQCGTYTGIVQIQFVIKNVDSKNQIDILDVLKPSEGDATDDKHQPSSSQRTRSSSGELKTASKVPKTTRWIVCPAFKELQKVCKIPQNPQEWSVSHVRQWLSWAICQFGLSDININSSTWSLNGKALFDLTHTKIRKLVPNDPGDVFYMHFELLRRTNVVAVVCDPTSSVPKPAPPKMVFTSPPAKSQPTQPTIEKNKAEATSKMSVVGGGTASSSGGCQQIQLWQFLLELLTDPKFYPIISWYGCDGEFRLHQPEVVANFWGQRKCKPNMNYDKLSRALRYYYDGDMIAKVSGKRFVYRFVLDLKSVVGYSADELRKQVEECRTREGFSLDIPATMVTCVLDV